ncbi:Shugoshin protein [Rutstroemia sp. NJR-2017a WRK4]|nr:Shugoshin protein [Rutstroemia sp. NJR-2017a WRK4]
MEIRLSDATIVKRKFMRQNRDIARANSTQSLRIRNLENETSRLLAENLGLREQILRLEGELEHGRSRRVADRVSVVKSQLEERLLEIGALISGLGEESPRKKRSPPNSRQYGGLKSSPLRSPEQRSWKNMVTLSEAVASQEGKLPPILENKQYPRRTLERQEIQDILNEVAVDSTDSPDIGPPPVSQFVEEDPVKIDLPKKAEVEEREDEVVLDPVISMNLEQRKKRKDSMVVSDLKQMNRTESLQATRDNSGALKSGAKRKLSARDDEEPELMRSGDTDDFKFTRVSSEERTRSKAAVSSAKENSRPSKQTSTTKGLTKDKPTLAPSGRKVLAPKSVNNSPRKSSSMSNLGQENAKPGISDSFKDKLARHAQDDTDLGKAQYDQKTTQDRTNFINAYTEPETPAPVDIFTPLSSYPSTARPESRDTPPPTEVGQVAEGQRPSRRARGAVSYAEPNLRDKMRRPGKELVDAVTADGKVRAVKLEDAAPMTARTIKAEPESDDAWKRLPSAASADHSPLSSKTSAPIQEVIPSNISNHRKRRESILLQAEMETSGQKSLQELLAESRKSRAKSKEHSPTESGLMNALEDMGIYEFQGSPKRDVEEATDKPIMQERVPSRFSRRTSAMPENSAEQDAELLKSTGTASAPARATTSASAAAPAPRRRQSTMTSSSRSGSSAGNDSERETDTEKSLKRSSSNSGMSASASTRSDRVAGRRRSMMI